MTSGKDFVKHSIKKFQKEKERIEMQILKLAGWKVCCAPYFSVVGSWDCSKSPSGLCCYNHYVDPVHDNCVFCHQPEERK